MGGSIGLSGSCAAGVGGGGGAGEGATDVPEMQSVFFFGFAQPGNSMHLLPFLTHVAQGSGRVRFAHAAQHSAIPTHWWPPMLAEPP